MSPRDFDRLKNEIDELFAELWQVPRFAGHRRAFRPPADCYRDEEARELKVVIELPGVDPDSDMEITVDAQALRISGERPRPRGRGRIYQQMEIEYGRFERAVPLGDDVNVEGATAVYERGILTIALPLADERPREAPVKIEVARE